MSLKQPEVELVVRAPGAAPDDQSTTPTTDTPEVGRWYWVKWEDVEQRWLGCVTHLGSNYVLLTGADEKHGGTVAYRFHFNDFWESCEYVENPDPIIDGKILQHTAETRKLMDEVRRVTALLGVAHRQGLPAPQEGEVQALAIRSDEPVSEYKAALIKAKDETLPDLFKQIKASNGRLTTWMKVKIVPMEAEAAALGGTLGAVQDRIFSVELYAGLVESVEKVREGEHAPNDTKIHLMQRRHYMDEECLVGYEHGGMDYKSLADFERWLSKPKNFNRILPFPKCVVAFRIRRKDKHREMHTYTDYVRVMAEREADRSTFLYIRNGEALYRMETQIEFEEKLFPDTRHKILTAGQLWAKKHPYFRGINHIITDAEYQGRIEDEAKEDAENAKLPEKERHWRHRSEDTVDVFERFTPESVYFDDINKVIQDELKKHNRIVLILQGLLDRSPVFVPHPPWQLWTGAGFELAFDLHYDDSRALSDGEKPNFEEYRAKLNSRLWSGSLTIGQEDAWEIREAEKECRRRDNDLRDEGRYRPDRYRPQGDPGPGTLARVHKYNPKQGACTYKWERKKRNRGWASDVRIEATLTTGEENVLNVDAYTPGDYLIFFNDPRTRQEYLKWAPMLLEAEEAHAGNRDLKPNRLLTAVVRKPVVRDHSRPMDLAPEKERPKKPPIADTWGGKKVRTRFEFSTTKGDKFAQDEILVVVCYERKKLTLEDPNDDKRHIHSVPADWVVLLE
jgi:hypothetical protein